MVDEVVRMISCVICMECYMNFANSVCGIACYDKKLCCEMDD